MICSVERKYIKSHRKKIGLIMIVWFVFYDVKVKKVLYYCLFMSVHFGIYLFCFTLQVRILYNIKVVEKMNSFNVV